MNCLYRHKHLSRKIDGTSKNTFELFHFSTKKNLHDLLEAKDIAAAVELLRAAHDTWPAEELFNFKVPM